jgi:hypothetical protein
MSLNWERANTLERERKTRSPRVRGDSGEIILADGTITSPQKIQKAERLRQMDRLQQCVRCGELKNGHHYTTVPGRERRICSKCVAADPTLDQTTSIKHQTGNQATGKLRRLIARFASTCNGCNARIQEGDTLGWDPISREGFCEECSVSLDPDFPSALNTLTTTRKR